MKQFADDTTPAAVTVVVMNGSHVALPGQSVIFATTLGNGALSKDSVVTDAFGTATVMWRLDPTPGQQIVTAHIAGHTELRVSRLATVVDPRDADFVAVSGGDSASGITLVFADSVNERLTIAQPDTMSRFFPRDSLDCDWVAALSRERVPALQPSPWTSKSDTARLRLRPTFSFSLTVWLVDDSATNAQKIRDLVSAANGQVFGAFGIRIGNVSYRRGSPVISPTCETAPLPPDTDKVTIYIATNAAIASAGYTCSDRVIIIRGAFVLTPNAANSPLLAHELGHAMGLSHVSDIDNFMNPAATGSGYTTGQVLFAHFNPLSSLNSVYHLHDPVEYMCYLIPQEWNG